MYGSMVRFLLSYGGPIVSGVIWEHILEQDTYGWEHLERIISFGEQDKSKNGGIRTIRQDKQRLYLPLGRIRGEDVEAFFHPMP